MDPTEDLSARILLKHILVTEPPRTPVTRSETQRESSSGLRRSSRLSNKDTVAQTPQNILRRSLKQKLHEGITRKSLPSTNKRRTASIVLKKTQTPAAASLRLSDGDTPRHLLRNILQTEPVRSPVVHEKGPSEEQDLPSATNTVTRTRPSIELSGLDLPDVTISHAASTAKGLSRKRPRRSLNVTAFEKRLKDGDDAEEEAANSTSDHLSLSLSSSTSLSLKTPFVDVRTEKRGLQRRASNRRKITEEEFGAAVNRREMGVVSSYTQMAQDLSETTHSEGFTLGLSKLSEPDITTDIVNCNTALYDLPDGMTSNTSIVATQDKPTVMASQLQREMQEEEESEVKLETEKSVSVLPHEEEAAAESQSGESVSEAQLQEDVDESEPQNKTAHDQQETAAVTSTSEEEDDAVESQTADTDDKTDYEEVEAQTEEEGAADSEEAAEANDQFEGEQVAVDSTVGEEGSAASQIKKDAADSLSEDVEAGSQSQEEEEAALGSETKENEDEEEEDAVELQSENDAAGFQFEDVEVESQSEKDEVVVEAQSEVDHHEEREEEKEEEEKEEKEEEEEEEEEEEPEHDLEHVSRRAHRSEGVLVVPMTEAGEELAEPTGAGWSDSKSEAHLDVDLNTSFETRSQESSRLHMGRPDGAEPSMEEQEDVSCPENDPEAGKESSFHLLQVTQDIRASGHLSDPSPEGIPAQDADEKEEEWEEDDDDDDEEEFPSKTPAFVKEKRNFFLRDPQASPSVFRNIQASSVNEAAAKPKQVKPRKTRTSKKNTVLPKAYLMNVFRHFAKTKVSADVYPVLNEIMDTFFGRLAVDLETYATHAKRKTIDIEDAKLLLMRQGYVNDKVPVEVLIEKYLRLEQRKLLIPIATSGNVVIPKRRR